MRQPAFLLINVGVGWALGFGFGLEGITGLSTYSTSYYIDFDGYKYPFESASTGALKGGRLTAEAWFADRVGVELGLGVVKYFWEGSLYLTTAQGILSIPVFVK